MIKFNYSFFHISVILSIPNNPKQQNINVSIIVGACLQVIAQYNKVIITINHPITPHNLLELIPECEANTFLINYFIYYDIFL